MASMDEKGYTSWDEPPKFERRGPRETEWAEVSVVSVLVSLQRHASVYV